MSEAPSLLDRIQGLVEQESFALPVFSETATRLHALASREYELSEVESVIMGDQALVAEVLQVANSAFFRGLSEIGTIRAAVMRIGLPKVLKIVSITSERSKYQARDPLISAMVKGLWRRTSAATLASDWLARRLNRHEDQEVYLAGLLHDVGELVLLRALDEFKISGDPTFPLSAELVEEVLSNTHPELGFRYLQQRRIPEIYCRIARDHHQETCDQADRLMALIRLADLAVRKTTLSLHPDPSLVLATTHEASCLNVDEIALAELEIMLEDFALSQG